MERKSIQEIAAVLTAKSGLKKKDAERFAMTLFDVVKEALETDRLVKVKGLGTFKIIDIEARESINVNTGERVRIDGHDKITFTPDASMKELVNKPFSQFETVVLNDGVDFSDDSFSANEESTAEELTEEEDAEAAAAAEIPRQYSVADDVPSEMPADIPMEYPVVDETPQVVTPQKEEPAIEEFIPSIGLLGVPETTEAPASNGVSGNTNGLDTTDEQEVVDDPAVVNESLTNTEPEISNVPETDSEPEPQSEPETGSETETKSGPKTDSEQETVAEPETDNEPDTDIEPETDEEAADDDSPSKTPWVLAAVLACVLSFAVGYFIGRSSGSGDQSLAQQEDRLAAGSTKTDSAKVSVAKMDTTLAESLKGDTMAAARQNVTPDAPAVPDAGEKPVAPVEPVAPVAPPVTSATQAKSATSATPAKSATAASPAAANTDITASDKYAQMDARVRTGAYRIVGTDYQVTVRAGETTARIARRTLGPDMECYIEVYNGIKSNSELKAGQKLNIPKLQWKKKKKTVNN